MSSIFFVPMFPATFAVVFFLGSLAIQGVIVRTVKLGPQGNVYYYGKVIICGLFTPEPGGPGRASTTKVTLRIPTVYNGLSALK